MAIDRMSNVLGVNLVICNSVELLGGGGRYYKEKAVYFLLTRPLQKLLTFILESEH
jgi:hypothetical protein